VREDRLGNRMGIVGRGVGAAREQGVGLRGGEERLRAAGGYGQAQLRGLARRADQGVEVVEKRIRDRDPLGLVLSARTCAGERTDGIVASTRSVPPRRSSIFSSLSAG